ncbi:hypothetical protein [Paenibacillus chitinolyticus]|uniref:hypothetical protein n=1 Tax=Paenibacillus chitinolyticus TaxID=79263 RepID=UPI001C48B740|nr:hypothetical protein [Paenibacillus chitinolyticus]MBV6712286.1 hypothetical protein [Paenibacillus chitinolyticus]
MEWLGVVWTWIVTDGWQFVVSIIAGTSAAKLFVDYSFKKKLEEDKQVLNKELERHKKELNVELESHKQALSVMTENSKFEYQRMMHDFSLYRNKKHEIYPELYKLLVSGHYEIGRLVDDWSMPNFDNYTKDIMEKFLFSWGLVENEIQELLKDWGVVNNKNNMVYKIKMLDWTNTFHHFRHVNEYYLQSQLYLSQESSKSVKQYIDASESMMRRLISFIHAKSYELIIRSTPTGYKRVCHGSKKKNGRFKRPIKK